jgi:hypothetical protein
MANCFKRNLNVSLFREKPRKPLNFIWKSSTDRQRAGHPITNTTLFYETWIRICYFWLTSRIIPVKWLRLEWYHFLQQETLIKCIRNAIEGILYEIFRLKFLIKTSIRNGDFRKKELCQISCSQKFQRFYWKKIKNNFSNDSPFTGTFTKFRYVRAL